MPSEQAPAERLPPPEWEPVVTRPDPMTEEEREAWLAADDDEPFDPEEWWDPEGPPPPGEDELTAEELAEIEEAATDELLALKAAWSGRRGPGQAGSARVFPGESSSPAAGFGTGLVLDVMPGCAGLALAADTAAGDDAFAGVADHELVGVLCAWDRIEAHAAARKLAAVAEVIRRRAEPGCAPEGAARMPTAWDEFAADELAAALGESRGHAEGLLDFARALAVRLPGTKAALWDGLISRYKAEIISYATALLDPAEARAAEARVLDRAPRLTPAGLRAAIARAVMEVAPDKARQRREAGHATCTSPICRRPAATCDYEHNVPYEAGGRTCLCNGGPKCRHDHRLKQHPKWKVDQLPDGTFRWATPSGRLYTTEPTAYPI